MTILLLCQCNTTKYLGDDQYLIKETHVKFLDESEIADRFRIESDLKTILKQRPNTRYVGIKREWLYIKGQQLSKDRGVREFMFKNGEPPVVLNDSLTKESHRVLTNYLFNQGYFDASVTSKVDTNKKKVEVTYLLTTNAPYNVDEIIYISQDTAIQGFVDSLKKTTLLKVGRRVKNETYEQEKNRITKAFLNHGYVDFYSNLIRPLQLDTIGGQTKVRLEITSPGKGKKHIKKSIGNIYVYKGYDLGKKQQPLDTIKHNDLIFYEMESEPYVIPPTLSEKIYLRPGSIAKQEDYDNTYRGLSDLGVYDFISVNPTQGSDPSKIDYAIQLTPNEKWVFDAGLDLNYSTIQTEGAGRNLLGITGSSQLENRNLFNRAINLSLKAEVGYEFNLDQVNRFNTFNTNFQATLKIPKFTGFPGTLRFLSLLKLGGKNILNPEFYKQLQLRASTQMNAQYQSVAVTDFYQYVNANLTYGYDVPINPRKRYTINTLGINYYRPDTLSQFSQITQNQEYVLRSFLGDRLFTGFLYRDFSFFYRSRENSLGNYWIFNASNEVSGLEVWAVNSLYNSITNKTGKFILNLDEEIDFARFARLDFQFRKYYKLRSNQELVIRINPGIAFSLDTFRVPYVKQFFMGGPQSLRAWNIREVGPGGNTSFPEQPPFFSAGDIKLEMNLEYRFDLFWLLKGALFVDAGNVWLLKDASEEDGQFSTDFYKQIAVGTGFGVRMDLEFVLFRLDLGYKIRNPYKKEGSYWYNNKSKPIVIGRVIRDINLNLAIGYPF